MVITKGNMMASVEGPPMPGKNPTRLPIKTPRAMNPRDSGVSTPSKPLMAASNILSSPGLSYFFFLGSSAGKPYFLRIFTRNFIASGEIVVTSRIRASVFSPGRTLQAAPKNFVA